MVLRSPIIQFKAVMEVQVVQEEPGEMVGQGEPEDQEELPVHLKWGLEVTAEAVVLVAVVGMAVAGPADHPSRSTEIQRHLVRQEIHYQMVPEGMVAHHPERAARQVLRERYSKKFRI